MKSVLRRIEATKKTVSTVLLVGGFGQGAYLRDRIRAVVRSALMKGLASTTPNFATVRVSGRSARKHYGIESDKAFEVAIHEESRKVCSEFICNFNTNLCWLSDIDTGMTFPNPIVSRPWTGSLGK